MTETDADVVESPCIGVCKIEPSSGFCRGCLRTLPEIAGWSAAREDERRAILVAIAERQRQGHGVVVRRGRGRG